MAMRSRSLLPTQRVPARVSAQSMHESNVGPSAAPHVASPDDVVVYFDPPVHQLRRDSLFDRESNPYAGDKILAPYAAVHQRLAERGIEAHTADLLPDRPDGRRNILISYGMPDRMPSHTVRKYQALASRPDVVLSAFFAMECPIVEPGLYERLPEFAGQFRRVLSWSDTASLLPFTEVPVDTESFRWPQSFDRVHDELWETCDRAFLVMINTNKLPRLYVDELYTARLRAVHFFQAFGEIDLYGRYWNAAPRRVGKTRTPATFRRLGMKAWELRQRLLPDPLYVAAAAADRGSVRSKSSTLARYRFALCFENSVLRGWMTEKLFDCFFVGTIPIYWGAPEILDVVPKECFIDMRQFTDFAELRAFLHALTPAAVDGYREAARDYLASARFAEFRLTAWVELHARIVADDTGLAV